MAGRGPAPKRGAKLGHRSRAASGPRTPVKATSEPRRPCPPGDWHAQARAWWDGVAASLAAARWEPEDWLLAQRGLAFVDRWWRLIDDDRADAAVRAHAELRHVETALQLTPVERAKAGIYPAVVPPKPSGSRSRARLRAVQDNEAGR